MGITQARRLPVHDRVASATSSARRLARRHAGPVPRQAERRRPPSSHQQALVRGLHRVRPRARSTPRRRLDLAATPCSKPHHLDMVPLHHRTAKDEASATAHAALPAQLRRSPRRAPLLHYSRGRHELRPSSTAAPCSTVSLQVCPRQAGTHRDGTFLPQSCSLLRHPRQASPSSPPG